LMRVSVHSPTGTGAVTDSELVPVAMERESQLMPSTSTCVTVRTSEPEVVNASAKVRVARSWKKLGPSANSTT
jgi:hypothetical protein